MENNIFDKWNSNVDLKGLQEDVKKAQEFADKTVAALFDASALA